MALRHASSWQCFPRTSGGHCTAAKSWDNMSYFSPSDCVYVYLCACIYAHVCSRVCTLMHTPTCVQGMPVETRGQASRPRVFCPLGHLTCLKRHSRNRTVCVGTLLWRKEHTPSACPPWSGASPLTFLGSPSFPMKGEQCTWHARLESVPEQRTYPLRKQFKPFLLSAAS